MRLNSTSRKSIEQNVKYRRLVLSITNNGQCISIKRKLAKRFINWTQSELFAVNVYMFESIICCSQTDHGVNQIITLTIFITYLFILPLSPVQ